MSYENLEVSQQDDVLRIALDRPDSLNAVNAEMHSELATVFRDAYSRDASVVMLTGNGDAFSAGGDIGWMQNAIGDPEAFRQTIREAEEILQSLINLEKPIIARLNGDAIGLGATLSLFCDITIARQDISIGDPHVSVGLVAGDGGVVIWPLLTSMNKAKELLMTGDKLTAEEAVDLGLINYAVPPAELDAKTDEMVQKLATGPQTAIRYTKMALNSWLEHGMNVSFRESIALEGLSQIHEDHEEGVAAFLEGRRPQYPSGTTPDET